MACLSAVKACLQTYVVSTRQEYIMLDTRTRPVRQVVKAETAIATETL